MKLRGLTTGRGVRCLGYECICVICVLAALGPTLALCPLHLGYRLLVGKSIGETQASAVHGVNAWNVTNNTQQYVKACSQLPNCTAFSTNGELLLVPATGPWAELPATSGSCDGVYVRATLIAGGTWAADMSGVEVSSDFDLPAVYYTRIRWSACKQLCLDTPGCRSVSYLYPEQICRLKTATCAEAQLGVGCILRGVANPIFQHADRLATLDFVAGSYLHSVVYVGMTSSPGTSTDAEATCKQIGAQLASIHASWNLNTVSFAVSNAIRVMQSLDGSQPASTANASEPFAWLGGIRSTNANPVVSWRDGTRYMLNPQDYLVVGSGGCLALTGTSTTSGGNSTLVMQDCEAVGFPLCSVYPEGVMVARFQADSTVVQIYHNRFSHEDAAVFCARKNGRLFRPAGVRGRELILDVARHAPTDDIWMDGYCGNGIGCSWSNGSLIPPDMVVDQPADVASGCVLLLDDPMPVIMSSTACEVVKDVACEWPPESPTPDVPARVRIYQGSAYAFFAVGRTYADADARCKAFAVGGRLASVLDRPTDQIISQTWYELDPPWNNFVITKNVRRYLTYLGADNLKGSAAWLDGSPYSYDGDWLGGSGPIGGGCWAMSSLGPTGGAKWEVLQDCTLPFNYTCKVPVKAFVQPSAMLVSGALQPSAALADGAALYELHGDTPRTYPDAREACRARGGDMASLNNTRSFDDVTYFLRRLRHETVGFVDVMGDRFDYFVGALTNKTDTNLVSDDFYWQDGSPFSWVTWDRTFPPGQPVNFKFPNLTQTATAIISDMGLTVLARKRYNHNLPFLCKTPISEPLATQTADGDATYEVLITPYAVPYHAAEQVCQARGGHLAGVSTPLQLAAVSALCRQALQALPSLDKGGVPSHDVQDGCWVGLYCPGGYNTDVSHKDGFGERTLKLLAASQPNILRGSACNATADLLWLDGRAAAGGSEAGAQDTLLARAGAALEPSLRCGLIRPATNSSNASFAMASCKLFAAFVCEVGLGDPALPRLALKVDAELEESAAGDAVPDASVQYHGCFALAPAAAADQTATWSPDLTVTPTPLPILLSSDAASPGRCYNLTREAGLTYFGIVGAAACWAGTDAPGLPFYNVPDDTPCYQSCNASSGATTVAGRQLGCGAPGFTTVYAVLDAANPPPTASDPAAATAYVCMAEQLLAAPNATLVGQLHISHSQLHACEALCTALAGCDLYTYHAPASACVLLGVPATASLASLPAYDARWARTTCVKATRLVQGAVLKQPAAAGASVAAGASPGTGPATHLCGVTLAGMLATAGERALSPLDRMIVSDLAACGASCAANATCQGFAVGPKGGGLDGADSSGNSSLYCSTRSGLVVDRGYNWLAGRAWVQLGAPEASAPAPGEEGCLVLSRLVPPPAYVCTDFVDAAGWELQRLPSADEQLCWEACRQDEQCTLYVVYSSPPSCSLRFRSFYNGTVWPAVAGTNLRPNAMATGVVRSCLHTYRLLKAQASPAVGRRTRQARLGADDSWHTCVAHMDVRGIDDVTMETSSETECAQECSTNPVCNFFITGSDIAETGSCYTKHDPYAVTLGESNEYPLTSGRTRVDMITVTDSCFNLDRQLHRTMPTYACATHYGLAFGQMASMRTDTAFACEAACDGVAACDAYMWLEHNQTCYLGADDAALTANRVWAALATGPSAPVAQTCLHVPRFMSNAAPASGQYEQANSVWHFCMTGPGLAAVLPAGGDGRELLGARTLQAAGGPASYFHALRACSADCAARDGCQVFNVAWQNGFDASPACVLQGWTSDAPLTNPCRAASGTPAAGAAGTSLTCMAIAADRSLPTAAGGLAHPRVRPAAVQSYRSKQYSVHLLSATYSTAAAICQGADGGGGGQLLSINSPQELAVVTHMLLPYRTPPLHPVAGVPPQLPAFWTGLQWTAGSSTGDCSGWCYSHGRPTNATFVAAWARTPGDASSACTAAYIGMNGTQTAAVAPLDCAAWSAAFVCEHEMPPANGVGGVSRGAPLQVFPAQVGYARAVALATAAGAVLAAVDLSATAAAQHARSLLDGAGSPLQGGARLANLSAAAAACGPSQLRASGCWVGLQPPADACSGGNNDTLALCGAHALLLADPASATSTTAQELASVLGPAAAANLSCAMALVSEASDDRAATYLPVSCSAPAAFLGSVVDPDAPLRMTYMPPPLPVNALPPSPDGQPSGGLSGGVIAGIVVGSVVGALLLVAACLLFVWVRMRRPAAAVWQAKFHAAHKDKAAAAAEPDLSPLQSAPTTASQGASEQENSAPSREVAQVKIEVMGSGEGVAVASTRSAAGLHNTGALVTSGSAGATVTGASAPDAKAINSSGITGLGSHRSAENIGSIDSWGERFRELVGGPQFQAGSSQLVVTAEDPDQIDVSWHIDPRRDITWDESDPLGKGAFGVVYRGTYKGHTVAVKTVMRGSHGKYEMDGLRALVHEARILAKVRHPNIVTCYGGCITDVNVFIVEELMSGNLGELISSMGEELLPLDRVLQIGIDIANGLFQLHPTIVHRDLKPDNVLLNAAGMAKISDFGLARFKLSSFLASTKHLAVGTIPYMAPETLREELQMISEKADIYSLAIILWAMLKGQQQPWQNYHYAAVLYKVSMRGERPELPADPARCSPRLMALIQRMWAQEPAARPGAGEVMKQLGVIMRDVQKGRKAATAAESSCSPKAAGGQRRVQQAELHPSAESG